MDCYQENAGKMRSDECKHVLECQNERSSKDPINQNCPYAVWRRMVQWIKWVKNEKKDPYTDISKANLIRLYLTVAIKNHLFESDEECLIILTRHKESRHRLSQ